MVARQLHGNAVLADRPCRVHAHERLPASLLDRFGDDSADAIVALLRPPLNVNQRTWMLAL
jgi:hypothetical protein